MKPLPQRDAVIAQLENELSLLRAFEDRPALVNLLADALARLKEGAK